MAGERKPSSTKTKKKIIEKRFDDLNQFIQKIYKLLPVEDKKNTTFKTLNFTPPKERKIDNSYSVNAVKALYEALLVIKDSKALGYSQSDLDKGGTIAALQRNWIMLKLAYALGGFNISAGKARAEKAEACINYIGGDIGGASWLPNVVDDLSRDLTNLMIAYLQQVVDSNDKDFPGIVYIQNILKKRALECFIAMEELFNVATSPQTNFNFNLFKNKFDEFNRLYDQLRANNGALLNTLTDDDRNDITAMAGALNNTYSNIEGHQQDSKDKKEEENEIITSIHKKNHDAGHQESKDDKEHIRSSMIVSDEKYSLANSSSGTDSSFNKKSHDSWTDNIVKELINPNNYSSSTVSYFYQKTLEIDNEIDNYFNLFNNITIEATDILKIFENIDQTDHDLHTKKEFAKAIAVCLIPRIESLSAISSLSDLFDNENFIRQKRTSCSAYGNTATFNFIINITKTHIKKLVKESNSFDQLFEREVQEIDRIMNYNKERLEPAYHLNYFDNHNVVQNILEIVQNMPVFSAENNSADYPYSIVATSKINSFFKPQAYSIIDGNTVLSIFEKIHIAPHDLETKKQFAKSIASNFILKINSLKDLAQLAALFEREDFLRQERGCLSKYISSYGDTASFNFVIERVQEQIEKLAKDPRNFAGLTVTEKNQITQIMSHKKRFNVDQFYQFDSPIKCFANNPAPSQFFQNNQKAREKGLFTKILTLLNTSDLTVDAVKELQKGLIKNSNHNYSRGSLCLTKQGWLMMNILENVIKVKNDSSLSRECILKIRTNYEKLQAIFSDALPSIETLLQSLDPQPQSQYYNVM